MNKNKIIFSSLLVIFTEVIVLVMGTVAWFSATQAVNTSTTSITVADNNIVNKIEVFNADREIAYQDGYRYFSGEVSDSFELLSYSPLEKRYQCLIKISLSMECSIIQLAAITDKTTDQGLFYIGDNNSSHKLQISGNPLSSIASFYVFNSTSPLLSYNSNTDIYTLTYGETIENNLKSFVNTSTKSLSLNAQNYGYVQFDSLNNVNSFFILITYNEIAINQIYEKFYGQSVLSGDSNGLISFNMDFHFGILNDGRSE